MNNTKSRSGSPRCHRCGGMLSKPKDVSRGRHWRCKAAGGRPLSELGPSAVKAFSLYPKHLKALEVLSAHYGGLSKSASVQRAIELALEAIA